MGAQTGGLGAVETQVARLRFPARDLGQVDRRGAYIANTTLHCYLYIGSPETFVKAGGSEYYRSNLQNCT